MSIFQLEIPRRSRHCEGCQQSFLPKAPYYSAFFPGDKAIRKDFCSHCWQEFPRESQLVYWRGMIPEKDVESELPKDKEERAMALLRSALLATTEPSKMEALYLALYLQRKKMLSLRKEMASENGSRFYLFEVPDTGEVFKVQRVNVSRGAMQSLQAKLATLLCRKK